MKNYTSILCFTMTSTCENSNIQVGIDNKNGVAKIHMVTCSGLKKNEDGSWPDKSVVVVDSVIDASIIKQLEGVLKYAKKALKEAPITTYKTSGLIDN